MKIRLQIGLAAIFTLLTLVVVAVTVGFLYVSNRGLALETANAAMADARAEANGELLNVILPVGRAVQAASRFVSTFPKAAQEFDGLNVLKGQISGLPQIYGIYFGVETDGAFHQVVQLPESLTTFGAGGAQIPDGATVVYRSIAYDEATSSRNESQIFQGETGAVLARATGTAIFDPRTRPWYERARDTDDVIVSPIYIFSSTGRLGITFSKRIVSAEGRLLGVVGADLTLDSLNQVLDRIRIGNSGLTFLLDKTGRMFAESGGGLDPEMVLNRAELSADKLGSPIARAAIEHWKSSKDGFFSFAVADSDERFLGSIAAMAPIYNMTPSVGIVVPEQQFVGAIVKSTEQVLKLSAIVLAVAILATIIIARLLSGHLRVVAEEAGRISNFDLEGEFTHTSWVKEVHDLERVVANMKMSLRNFGAYVPKDLVRTIVSSGDSVAVGGRSRQLSIMFTDIEGFTAKSETLAPEVLMAELSDYFEAMETEITRNRGTIDKYIGDAIMAIWNAPVEDPDHASHACRAALACLAAGERLNTGRADWKLLPVRTRFGLHADTVVVGNVGSAGRLQYTALGGAVNLASRIEALNKQYGTQILVSRDIAKQTGGRFVLRPVDFVSPAGTSHPTMVYELMGEADEQGEFPVSEATLREIEDWNVCYRLYRAAAWGEAAAAFDRHQTLTSRPKLVAEYVQRCALFADSPPEAGWDGSRKYETK